MLGTLFIIGGIAITLGFLGTRSARLTRFMSSDNTSGSRRVNTPSQVNLQVKDWVNKAQDDHGRRYARVPNRTALRG